MSTTPIFRKTGNRLLDAINESDFGRLAPRLELAPMPFKRTLQKQGEPVTHAYFPTGGLGSVTKVMGDGAMIELASAGRDGMIGASLFLGETLAEHDALVQIAGSDAWSLTAEAFAAELELRGSFWDLMRRYTMVFAAQAAQSAACNGLHNVEERCARWLLSTQDRVGSDHVRLTQEFMAVMLGVRRPTVTIVLGTLEKAGLLELRRGEIHITDRQRLEQASCECYRATVQDYQRLLPECAVAEAAMAGAEGGRGHGQREA